MTRCALILALGLAASCGGESEPLAKLVSSSGATDETADGASWNPASVGHAFDRGHGVRTGNSARASVRLRGGTHLALDPHSVFFFGARHRAPEGLALDLDIGAAEVVVGGEPVVLEWPEATTELAARSKAQVRRDQRANALELQLTVGSAVVIDRSGGRKQLGPGERVTLSAGAATEPAVAVAVDAGASHDAAPAAPSGGFTAEVSARSARLRAPGDDGWRPLAKGEHELVPNSEIRVPAKGQVVVRRDDQSVELSGPAEARLSDDSAYLLELRRGRGVAVAGSSNVQIRVPGGSIVSHAGPGDGSRVSVHSHATKTDVAVEIGSAVVVSKNGVRESLRLGERGTMASDGQIIVSGRAPKSVDLSVPIGERAAIHTARAPVAVALVGEGGCADALVVELSSSPRFRGITTRTQSSGEARVLLAAGTHYYRIRCLVGGSLQPASGTATRLRVVRDRAERPLEQDAPRNDVATDGRTYEVLYQSRPPAIRVTWPGAPSDGPFTLYTGSPSAPTELATADSPEVVLSSGKLSEGKHVLWFQAKVRKSRRARVSISFDNAAPSAYLRAPSVGEPWSDDVSIRGAVARGWTASLAGRALELDSQGRFSHVASRATLGRSFAIRTAHPKKGIRYIVRRAGR